MGYKKNMDETGETVTSKNATEITAQLKAIEAATAEINSEAGAPVYNAALHDLTGQLAPRSRRVYSHDAGYFATWLEQHDLSLERVTRTHLIEYRQHLGDKYARATAARMLIVARRLLEEAVERGVLQNNPDNRVKGFKSATRIETPHTALTRLQARELLGQIDRTTLIGKRDYALIMLLLRTGIRRSEAAALTLGDLAEEQGHHVAVIRHAKGDQLHKVKLPVEVRRALTDYLIETRRSALVSTRPAAPLFIQFRKSKDGQGKPVEQGLSDRSIAQIVHDRAAVIGVKISPHGLRASFVTLALEGGAMLQQVQYAVGHADPRTTERYQKRKNNLDDNAGDYIKL